MTPDDLDELEVRLRRRLRRLADAAPTEPSRTPGSADRQSSRRRSPLIVAGAAAAVATVGLAAMVLIASRGSDDGELMPSMATVDVQRRATSTTIPPEQPEPAAWDELPEAPIEGRVGAVAVVADDQFVVWGGASRSLDDDPRVFDDGAAYSFADREWQTLPPSPLSARANAVAAWTGTEIVILGGTDIDGQPRHDGAAWNPATGRWRAIESFGGGGAVDQVTATAWTGSELVLVGMISPPNAFLPSDTAAINITTGEPRYLESPSAPALSDEQRQYVPRGRAAVFTGDEVLVVTVADGFNVTIDRLNLDDDTWSETITTAMNGLNVGPTGVTWTGTRLVIVNHLGPGATFEPSTSTLSPIDNSVSVVRFPAVAVNPNIVFVGDRWLDVERNTWHDTGPVPGKHREFPVVVATQGTAYVWGGDGCGPAADCTRLIDPGPGLTWTPQSNDTKAAPDPVLETVGPPPATGITTIPSPPSTASTPCENETMVDYHPAARSLAELASRADLLAELEVTARYEVPQPPGEHQETVTRQMARAVVTTPIAGAERGDELRLYVALVERNRDGDPTLVIGDHHHKRLLPGTRLIAGLTKDQSSNYELGTGQFLIDSNGNVSVLGREACLSAEEQHLADAVVGLSATDIITELSSLPTPTTDAHPPGRTTPPTTGQ